MENLVLHNLSLLSCSEDLSARCVTVALVVVMTVKLREEEGRGGGHTCKMSISHFEAHTDL